MRRTVYSSPKRFEKGVTLIEMLVAMAIFSLMIVLIMAILADILQKRVVVKKMQQQIEETSLMMSYMAKKIRTSDLVPGSCNGSSCSIKDHGANNAIVTFSFTSGTSGSSGNLTENGVVIAQNVSGGFVAPSTSGVPRVTMYLKPSGEDRNAVQTTVSLRSY